MAVSTLLSYMKEGDVCRKKANMWPGNVFPVLIKYET